MSSLRENAVNKLLVLFIEIYFPYLNCILLYNLFKKYSLLINIIQLLFLVIERYKCFQRI